MALSLVCTHSLQYLGWRRQIIVRRQGLTEREQVLRRSCHSSSHTQPLQIVPSRRRHKQGNGSPPIRDLERFSRFDLTQPDAGVLP